MELTRLNKAIAQTGYCSRREADKLIEKGVVKINGAAVVLGDKVSASDEISVNGKVITKVEKKIYLIFNKPLGITCTTDERVKGNIVSYINYPERIYPIGRLDKPSEGLIFMTNDGDIVNKILRARNHHEKEYLVRVDKAISAEFVRKMSTGVPILDTITRKCKVEKIDEYTFTIVLTQGLNRQIRRMCEFLDYNVVSLKRLRIMNINLGSLKTGTYREFTQEEFRELNNLLKDSKKTID
ncbi:MAG: pseudouridine synthase [Chitinophagales bacterium]